MGDTDLISGSESSQERDGGEKWQPTPVFLLDNPMARGIWQDKSMGRQRIGHS